jgi:hypothetical protein
LNRGGGGGDVSIFIAVGIALAGLEAAKLAGAAHYAIGYAAGFASALLVAVTATR